MSQINGVVGQDNGIAKPYHSWIRKVKFTQRHCICLISVWNNIKARKENSCFEVEVWQTL